MTALTLVPSEIIKKWQEIVDLLAAIIHVPSAVVVRVEPSNSEVFVASDCKPSEPGFGEDYHSDAEILSQSGHEVMEQTTGVWIYEASELEGIGKRDGRM